MTAIQVQPRFPNLLVEVFNQGHLDAVHRVAKHHGYVLANPDHHCATVFKDQPKPWATVAHFGANAELYIFTAFTKDEVEQWAVRAANRNTVYAEYLGAKFKTLRKVSIEFDKFNRVIESRDNQAVLSVIPRPKFDVVVVSAPNICAPYGSSEFPECTCLDADTNTRKTCRMVKAYGGTCGKPFVKLLKANQEDKDKVIEWVRPKAENPIVDKVVVCSVLATSKIVSVVKRAFNFLRGIK